MTQIEIMSPWLSMLLFFPEVIVYKLNIYINRFLSWEKDVNNYWTQTICRYIAHHHVQCLGELGGPFTPVKSR